MIKNYNLFLVKEGIIMSNDDIIEIMMSLETEDNRNAALINKLVNHKDTKGVTVLMNLVRDNKEHLIDYVLKFNPDLNALTKLNENVLFFCKNIKMFNKFYNLGVDCKVTTTYNFNVLQYLSSKNIFNEETYQKLINDGVDINNFNLNNVGILDNLISNKKAVEFLIRNKINLNNPYQLFINNIFYEYNYYTKKRKLLLDIFEILFKNGLKINNTDRFISNMLNFNFYGTLEQRNKLIDNIILKIGKYFSDEMLINLYKSSTIHTYKVQDRDFAIKLLNTGNRQKFYDFLKSYWSKSDFYEYFENYIKEHPYFEDVTKYNL